MTLQNLDEERNIFSVQIRLGCHSDHLSGGVFYHFVMSRPPLGDVVDCFIFTGVMVLTAQSAVYAGYE